MIQIDIVMPRLFTEGMGDLQVEFELESGSLTALVGPSGSGKTTLLRLLAGLETPPQGRIVVDESVWLDTYHRVNRPPQQRPIGYVFQDTALFPNMTVRENIQYAAPKDQRTLVQELVEVTGLNTFIDQKPAQLSGGQRQRVALARALVRRPQLLLLDEPFAALDGKSGEALRQVLLKLHQTWGTTTLLVSHHEADVQALANRVIELVQGRIDTDRLIKPRDTATPLMERITHIAYDEAQQRWLIETDTTQLQSANPSWGQWQIGDLIQISSLTK